MNAFLCEANRRGMEYFYFDAFNAIWKQDEAGVNDEEFHWGLGNEDRTIKEHVAEALICTEESYNGWTRHTLQTKY